MTFNQFLERLKKVERKRRNTNGPIRCGRGKWTHCPISAVTGDPSHFNEPFTAGQQLGLSDLLARRIIRAADDEGSPATRRKLLGACGLGGQQ